MLAESAVGSLGSTVVQTSQMGSLGHNQGEEDKGQDFRVEPF